MTYISSERRGFPRHLFADDARALDINGGELGRISHINGSGVLLHCSSDSVADHLVSESELRIVIVEPRRQASSPVHVAVRYREGRTIGFEFIEEMNLAHAGQPVR